jgi:hypothetical protein
LAFKNDRLFENIDFMSLTPNAIIIIPCFEEPWIGDPLDSLSKACHKKGKQNIQ